MIQLNLKDGGFIWINPNLIASMVEVEKLTYMNVVDEPKTIIVQESPEIIIDLIKQSKLDFPVSWDGKEFKRI